MVDCAVQMHAWDNKLNVIYMYMSNLSRIVLISWTNDMFGAYAKSIRPAESHERVVFKWMHQMSSMAWYGIAHWRLVRTPPDFRSKFFIKKIFTRFRYLFLESITWLDFSRGWNSFVWSTIGQASDVHIHSVLPVPWFNSNRDTVSESKCLSFYINISRTDTHTRDAYRASRTELAFQINWHRKSFSI